LLIYYSYMMVRAVLAADKVKARPGLLLLFELFVITGLTIGVVRGEILPPGRLRALVYRIGVIVPQAVSYVALRYVLPALGNPLCDPLLLRIDLKLFGDTPARQLERFVSLHTVEWFSFFYYGYFSLVFLHVIASALLDRGRRPAELLFATMAICALGHTLYTLVPGVGPFAALAFTKPLSGGFFFGLVWEAVSSAGAVLDIFPSLHTAYPTLLTLHALRYRRTVPYRYTLVPTAFFAGNILIATLFLRWHYAIDVFAGLALAWVAHRLGIYFAARESDELRIGRQLVWEPL
jgi:hypothetical protein